MKSRLKFRGGEGVSQGGDTSFTVKATGPSYVVALIQNVRIMHPVLARKKYWRSEEDLLVYVKMPDSTRHRATVCREFRRKQSLRLISLAKVCRGSKGPRNLPNLPSTLCLRSRLLVSVWSLPISTRNLARTSSLKVRFVQWNLRTDGCDLTIASELNDGEYSQTMPRDGKDQRSQASSSSDSKPGYKDDVTRECAFPLAGT